MDGFACEDVRDGTRMFNYFESSLGITHRIWSGLPVLLSHDGGKEFMISSYDCSKVEHVPLSGENRHFRPGLESFFGTGNDSVEFFLSRLGGASNQFLSHRVEDVVVFGGLGWNKLAVEKVGIDFS